MTFVCVSPLHYFLLVSGPSSHQVLATSLLRRNRVHTNSDSAVSGDLVISSQLNADTQVHCRLFSAARPQCKRDHRVQQHLLGFLGLP